MDQNAITQFYNKLYNKLKEQTMASLIRLCNNDKHEALDLFQFSFIELWKQIEKGTEIVSHKAYLLTVARNENIKRQTNPKKKNTTYIDPNPSQKEDEGMKNIDDIVAAQQNNPFDNKINNFPSSEEITDMIAEEMKYLNLLHQQLLELEFQHIEEIETQKFKNETDKQKARDEFIAKTLGIVVGTMRVRRTHAKKALMERLYKRL